MLLKISLNIVLSQGFYGQVKSVGKYPFNLGQRMSGKSGKLAMIRGNSTFIM